MTDPTTSTEQLRDVIPQLALAYVWHHSTKTLRRTMRHAILDIFTRDGAVTLRGLTGAPGMDGKIVWMVQGTGDADADPGTAH